VAPFPAKEWGDFPTKSPSREKTLKNWHWPHQKGFVGHFTISAESKEPVPSEHFIELRKSERHDSLVGRHLGTPWFCEDQ